MDKNRYADIMKEREHSLDIIEADITGFIDYLKSDCTDMEILYLSEIFDEMVLETDDRELFDTLRETITGRFSHLIEEYRLLWNLDIALETGGAGAAIKKAQEAFRGAAEVMGIQSDDDVQAIVDEVRRGKLA